MFDQFQQAMAMMVQMFGTMHRDQMAVIREELDRLHDLTEEFHALKNELANRTQERGETVARGPAVDLSQSTATEPDLSARAIASEKSKGLQDAQEKGDATSRIQPSSLASSVPKQQLAPSPRLSSPTSPLKPAMAHSPSEELRESGPCSQANNNGMSVRADSEQNSIVWLHQRIMTLQQERETRWQKILKLLPGTS
jgi:hypothetical protein